MLIIICFSSCGIRLECSLRKFEWFYHKKWGAPSSCFNSTWMLSLIAKAVVSLTLNWSWRHTHCHQLVRECTEHLPLCSRTHIQHTEKHTDAVLALQQRNLFPVFCPRCVPRGTPVCWNAQPPACSMALPNPDPVASSAQMLWQRPRVGPAGPVWSCDSTITITPAAKNNRPTGMLVMQKWNNTTLDVNTQERNNKAWWTLSDHISTTHYHNTVC